MGLVGFVALAKVSRVVISLGFENPMDPAKH